MSEYMFGVTTSKLTADEAKRLDRIAKRHGARLCEITTPGTYRRWFACPNRGEPFNSALADAVLADIADLGPRYTRPSHTRSICEDGKELVSLVRTNDSALTRGQADALADHIVALLNRFPFIPGQE